ncbi:MAG: chlorohydrolase [Methanosarcinales archaeon]|nr:MAG: chlorohydrolase [Methanosarcinales archaeon]
MKPTTEISGTIIWGEEFEVISGTLYIEDGIIVDLIEKQVSDDVIIAPCFVNAHTHIGDSVIKDPPITNLDELVRPPDGLKHRMLNKTPAVELINAMGSTLKDMKKTGTTAFIDFREGGVEGVNGLRQSLIDMGNLRSIILGRPHNDLPELLNVSDGIGLSGVNDMPLDVLQEIVSAVKKSEKPFAIHAGEKDKTDIDAAFDLEPDFIVHLTSGSSSDFKRAFDQDCNIVVCPRSNLLTGAGMPDIKGMLTSGAVVGVGTDNVMLNSTNMFDEMKFISTIFLQDDRQVFKLCTLNGAKVSNMDNEIGSIETGKMAHLMVLNRNSYNLQGVRNHLSGLVRRARPDDIIQIIGVE